MAKPFSGWSEAAFDFYRQLEADNSRTFWLAHKTAYDDEVRAPFDALSALVAAEFGELRVFRPNRDVRFSKDKSPYKTQCYAVGEGDAGEGFYVGISATRLSIGAGFWMMAPDQLSRYRAAVDDDRYGPTLVAAVKTALAAGLELEGQPLKTAPRGWPRDHPRVELLRCRSVAVLRFFEPAAWLGTPAVLDQIVEVWRQAAPVNAWMGEHVGPSTLPPLEFSRGG